MVAVIHGFLLWTAVWIRCFDIALTSQPDGNDLQDEIFVLAHGSTGVSVRQSRGGVADGLVYCGGSLWW